VCVVVALSRLLRQQTQPRIIEKATEIGQVKRKFDMAKTTEKATTISLVIST